MNNCKKLIVLFTLFIMSAISTTLYAKDSEGYNVVVKEYVQSNGKTTTGLASDNDDGYIRIAQPTKVSTSTFESKINLMGETKKGTEITIAVYNKKDNTKSTSEYKDEPTTTYELSTVGLTGTFNQLIDLLEGDNKIVLSYVNTQDNKKDYMIFYINRGSEQDKELLKNYLVFSVVK